MFTALAATLLLSGTQPVPDSVALNVPATVTVSAEGLDLADPRDVAKLDRRIRDAVDTVCGTASPADLAGQNRVDDCRTETRALVKAERDGMVALAGKVRPTALAMGR